MKEVLASLLDNAIKFTASGRVNLSVREVGTSCALEFAVSDTGAGLTPEQVKTIEQPFAQVDGASTRQGTGIGMGLTMVKQLLQLMSAQMKSK